MINHLDLEIFSNLIAPSIAGLFFFIYFIFFIFVNNSKARSFKSFIVFLISFSIFLISRPLQLFLGPFPMSLIIVNIRVLILCIIVVPSMMITSNIFLNKNNSRWNIAIILSGFFLGILYVIFNTLGTRESQEIFRIGNLIAYDSLTPSMSPPYYGREVTIFAQTTTGVLLFIFSLIKLIFLKVHQKWNRYLRNKTFLFNCGIFIFASTFIIGSVLKQWWIYYFFSMFSALLFGMGVLIDIKSIYHNFEKLVPFIKEDIVHNVTLSDLSKSKLIELLKCLGKKIDLDTFAIIKANDDKFKSDYTFHLFDEISDNLKKNLDNSISEENYLLIPLENIQIGIVINLLSNSKFNQTDIFKLFETIQNEILVKKEISLTIGIGASYKKIENIRNSYYDAIKALEYAEKHQDNAIIHAENVHQIDFYQAKYPIKEKTELLSAIKIGDLLGCKKSFVKFSQSFKKFIDEKPEILKVRLCELVGSIVDSAILGGGNENKLNELVKQYFNDINSINNISMAEKWLENLVIQIVKIVANEQHTHTKVIIEKAKKYVKDNYMSQLSYKDVAQKIFVSPSYFLGLFKQETGITFVDYLTKVRIEKSKQLMLSTNESITFIAYEVGFNNSNYFSIIFKKHVGISPKKFSKRNKHLAAMD